MLRITIKEKKGRKDGEILTLCNEKDNINICFRSFLNRRKRKDKEHASSFSF
jgi:hypothetical protein